MASTILSYSQSNRLFPQHLVSLKVVLYLYAIIPVCIGLQLLDRYCMNGLLLASLPSSPNHYLVFQVLFGIPHILASAIILGSNSEYVQFFKVKLLWMTLFIVLLFGIGSLWIPYKVLYLLTAFLTVYHVLKQQHGIVRGICRLPNWGYNGLLTLSVAAGSLIYVGIFLKNSLSPIQVSYLQLFAGGLCCALLIATVLSQYYVTTWFGRLFLWANSFLVFSSLYLYTHQYYFLAILIPRLVHDATAFMVYVTHDYNRHQQAPTNFIYRCAARWQIPIFMVLPCIAFGLAFLLQSYGDAVISFISRYIFDFEIRKAVTLGLLGYLSLMHYYSESFTWKQGSPYRRYIGFKS